MKIPQEYPQFDKKTLIIITGSHEASFYTAFNGELEELLEFKIPTIKYSDREGFFLRRAFGKVFGGGSVYEPKKEQELKEFLDKFKREIKKIMVQQGPEGIILITPEYIENAVLGNLPHETSKKITITLNGNYSKSKPVEVLEKIREKIMSDQPTAPMSEEVKKILNKKK